MLQRILLGFTICTALGFSTISRAEWDPDSRLDRSLITVLDAYGALVGNHRLQARHPSKGGVPGEAQATITSIGAGFVSITNDLLSKTQKERQLGHASASATSAFGSAWGLGAQLYHVTQDDQLKSIREFKNSEQYGSLVQTIGPVLASQFAEDIADRWTIEQVVKKYISDVKAQKEAMALLARERDYFDRVLKRLIEDPKQRRAAVNAVASEAVLVKLVAAHETAELAKKIKVKLSDDRREIFRVIAESDAARAGRHPKDKSWNEEIEKRIVQLEKEFAYEPVDKIISEMDDREARASQPENSGGENAHH